MTLIKWKPQPSTMLSEFDRFWSDFLPRSPEMDSRCCEWAPRVDIVENAKNYQIVVELPGFEKSDVKLKVEEQVLTISGERKMEEETEGRNYRRVERLYGSFERRFRLPQEAELDKISAEMKDGLLTVTLEKSEKVAGREIQVK